MSKLKGTIYVAIGAASYGVLATFVKIAGGQGYATGAITFTQFATGAVVLFMLDLFLGKPATRGNAKEALMLMAAGTSLGLTSTFYYLSIKYLPVSVCIILLMQTIWMGILVDCIRQRKKPALKEVITVLIVLGGTLLATGLSSTGFHWHLKGLIFGLLAAVCYTTAMLASNGIAVGRNVFFRSKFLVSGGLIAILVFWNIHLLDSFNWHLEWRFGLMLGLFGTILPPLLFSKGFPILGLGWGSVLAAIEIPVSIGTAYLFLKEQISATQLLGCICIIGGIVFRNVQFKRLVVATLLLFPFVANASTVDTLQVRSNAMNKNILTLVVKPDKPGNYPSIYVLHGYSGHPYRTLQLDIPSLKQLADLYHIAFVLPDGNYDKWYINSTKQKDVQYETFLGKELPAYIDTHYPTVKSRFARAIMGWSMGGYGAMHVGGMYAAQFGAIGSICGAVSLEPYVATFGIDKLIDAASWKQYDVLSNCAQYQFTQQQLILTCGDADPFLPYNRALHQQLNQLRVDHSYLEQPGAHNFEYWRNAAAYVVLFMHQYFDKYSK